MTEISQEDKNTIDNFFDKLKDMATTGGDTNGNTVGQIPCLIRLRMSVICILWPPVRI